MPRLKRLVPLALFAVLVAGCTSSGEPDALRQGRSVYGDVCSVCHGARGQGRVGPALSSVLETWPSCADHVEWVSIGSEGWRATVGDTYGATDKPITAVMPAHQDTLTQEEIQMVAAFERIEYGGADPDTALSECGVE